MTKLQSWVESKFFEWFTVGVIALNAVTLGIETHPSLSEGFLQVLYALDKLFLSYFVVELFLKGLVYRFRFFHDPWRVFDFVVVGIALLPASGSLSVLRSLRILRTLRMISVIPALKRVVNGLMVAVPGLGAVSVIMLLLFYVGSVVSTKLFGESFPDWFGNIGASAYSLFQIMTLESWSMGIVRPVMETYPYAWLFFLPFILLTTFTMLNLFIAVIVNAMQAETDEAARERADQGHDERSALMTEIREIRRLLNRHKIGQ